MGTRKAPAHPSRRPRMTSDHLRRVGERVKSTLGYPGTLIGWDGPRARVEWDIGAVTLEFPSDLRFGEWVPPRPDSE